MLKFRGAHRANGLIIEPVVRQAGSVPLHLAVDSTGLKIVGEGEWLAQKYKTKGIRRRWRKLHLGLDLASWISLMPRPRAFRLTAPMMEHQHEFC